jgi:hypothetical protein
VCNFEKMLKLILFISSFWLFLNSKAQKISYSYYAYVRAGFENQIGFSTDFVYDSVKFEMNGVVCRSDSNNVIVNPEKPGINNLNSKAYLKWKLIYSGSFPLEVLRPEVFGIFGSDLQKKLKISFIKSYPGVRVVIRVNNYHWESIGIISYRLSIIRDREIIFSNTETSNRFSDTVKAKLEKLEVGDLILISEIIVDGNFKDISNTIPTVYEVEL